MTLPDVDSLSTYGGALNDYSPVIDPTTDESAAYRNKYAANVAMLTHTAARAMRSFVGATGATPTDPVSGFVHDAVWGNTAPLKPVVARTSAGLWTVTWAASVNDELAVAHTVNFRRARVAVECGATLFHVTCAVTAANVITVRGWTNAGVADDLNGLVVTVWGY